MSTLRSRTGPPVPGRPKLAFVAAILSGLALGQAALSVAEAQRDSTRQPDSSVLVGQLSARETHLPIGGAHVVVIGTELRTTTDSLGRFTLRGVPAEGFAMEIRAVGYAPRTWGLGAQPGQAVPRLFELDPLPYELPGVVVKGKQPLSARRFADFARRRQSGLGAYLTQEQIERLHPTTLVEVLVTVRGVQQVCEYNDCIAKMVRSPPGCYPQYFLDGHESTPYFARHTPPFDVKGIEIYRGSSETPGEFLGTNSGCGVIAIWTRSSP
jgi:hypothetical protein